MGAGLVLAVVRELVAVGDVVCHTEQLLFEKQVISCTYRVFINECNEALAYHFGQMATYDLEQVAKVSYMYEILIFGF